MADNFDLKKYLTENKLKVGDRVEIINGSEAGEKATIVSTLGKYFKIKFDNPQLNSSDPNLLVTADPINLKKLSEGKLHEDRTGALRNLLEKVYEDAIENVEYDEMGGYSSKPFNEYWNENIDKITAIFSKI